MALSPQLKAEYDTQDRLLSDPNLPHGAVRLWGILFREHQRTARTMAFVQVSQRELEKLLPCKRDSLPGWVASLVGNGYIRTESYRPDHQPYHCRRFFLVFTGPEKGTSASPEKGTSASPEKGTSASPEKGTSASPEKGTSASPEKGTSAYTKGFKRDTEGLKRGGKSPASAALQQPELKAPGKSKPLAETIKPTMAERIQATKELERIERAIEALEKSVDHHRDLEPEERKRLRSLKERREIVLRITGFHA